MTQPDHSETVTHFYDTHPINETQILQTLQSKGIPLESLTEDVLQAYDQDHYGGVEALDILAHKAGIQATSFVLDVCCGIGGPARYLAHHYGCRVMGLDLTESRIQSARRFTQMVKLEQLVDFRQGNALDMPFADRTFDVIIGQEAWAYVPNRARLIVECARVVQESGIVAFTDILQRGALSVGEQERLQREMVFSTLETLEDYREKLTAVGFTVLEHEDLSDHWATILRQRLEMYRSLKDETIAKFSHAHYRQWDDIYSFFCGVVCDQAAGRWSACRTSRRQVTVTDARHPSGTSYGLPRYFKVYKLRGSSGKAN